MPWTQARTSAGFTRSGVKLRSAKKGHSIWEQDSTGLVGHDLGIVAAGSSRP